MHPAQNRKPNAPAKMPWSAPALRRIELTDRELAVVKNSDDPSSALANIYRRHREAERDR